MKKPIAIVLIICLMLPLTLNVAADSQITPTIPKATIFLQQKFNIERRVIHGNDSKSRWNVSEGRFLPP